jgi:sugar phosphate isomerase/epimerase
MAMLKIGCQLIIFGRERIANDLAGVFQVLAGAGYAGAEVGDLSSQIRAADLKKLLGGLGLELVGTHVGFDALKGDVGRLCDYLTQAGGEYLICSGVGDRAKGLAAYEEAASLMNEVGKEVAGRGLTLCYHNHSFEFQKFAGKTALLRLYELTDPAAVKLCIDIYWVHHGGEDPAVFVARYADRTAILHLKDMKETTFAEVGQGVLDFPAILKAVEGKPVPWAVVEQDRTARTPEESVRLSRQYLKERLGL